MLLSTCVLVNLFVGFNIILPHIYLCLIFLVDYVVCRNFLYVSCINTCIYCRLEKKVKERWL